MDTFDIGVAIGSLSAYLVMIYLPLYFFCTTISSTLKEISAENRKMEPAKVWLILIPFFGAVWQFILVYRVADSLKAEFAEREIQQSEDRPGTNIGIAFCILFCCSIVPGLGGFAVLGGLVCWIIYWVKISGYKTLIITAKGGSTM